MDNEKLDLIKELNKTYDYLTTLYDTIHQIDVFDNIGETYKNIFLQIKRTSRSNGLLLVKYFTSGKCLFEEQFRTVLLDSCLPVKHPVLLEKLPEFLDLKFFPMKKEELSSLMIVPIQRRDRIYAHLILWRLKQNEPFYSIELKIVTALCELIATTMYICETMEEEKKRFVYEMELQKAKQMQEGLLPYDLPKTKELEVDFLFEPYIFAGGDILDFCETEQKFAFMVADVQGKGISAAILASAIRSLWFYLAQNLTPSELTEELNKALWRVLHATSNIFTIVCGEYDKRSGLIKIANCAHPPPILFSGFKTKKFEATSIPLGFFEEYETTQQTFPFGKDDYLLLYTDGAIEIEKKGKTSYELSFLENIYEKIIKNSRNFHDILPNLMEQIKRKGKIKDDVALFLIKGKESL